MIVIKLLFWPFRLFVYCWYKLRFPFKKADILVHHIPDQFAINQRGGFLSLLIPDKSVLFWDYIQLLDFYEKSHQLKEIVVHASHLHLNWSQIHTIGTRLERIAKSQKKVYGYSEGGDLKSLYLLSFIKTRYVSPKATFISALPSGESFFIKNVLQKFGVQLETTYAGKYKAGGFETFTRNGFSEAAKAAQKRLIGDFRKSILAPFQKITYKKALPKTKQKTIRNLADLIVQKSILNAAELKDAGFFADLVQVDALMNHIFVDQQSRVSEIQKHKFLNNNHLRSQNDALPISDKSSSKADHPENEDKTRESHKLKLLKRIATDKKLIRNEKRKRYRLFDFKKTHHIALLALEGNINMGNVRDEPNGASIQALCLRKTIKELEDSRDEAVFLYINSPGGSAEASEILYNSIQSLALVKPVFAIVGGVAASGGYYLACAANRIYTSPFSLLGSIGVIRLRPEVSKFYKKAGIAKEKIFRDPTADVFSENGPMSGLAKKLNQESLNDTYQLFIQRVAEGRYLNNKQVLKMAEGQVFLSGDFIKHGMVDEDKDLMEVLDYYKNEMNYPEHSRIQFNLYPAIKVNIRSLMSTKLPGILALGFQNHLQKFGTSVFTLPKSLDYLLKNTTKPMFYDLNNFDI